MPRDVEDGVARSFQLERFQEYLALEDGASPRTLEAYGRDLARLAVWCTTKGVAAPAGLTPTLLRDFVYHLKDMGLSPASIRRSVSATRTYFKFMIGEGQMQSDPSGGLETPRKWRTLPEVLTGDEVNRLLAAVSLDERLVFRDRAMLELAYGAGLRVSEWIELGVQDLMLDDGVLRVFGKGST